MRDCPVFLVTMAGWKHRKYDTKIRLVWIIHAHAPRRATGAYRWTMVKQAPEQ